MPDWKTLCPGKYLTGRELPRPVKVEILSVSGEILLDEEDESKRKKGPEHKVLCVIKYLDPLTNKPVTRNALFNKTNCVLTETIYGRDYEGWVGKLLFLHNNENVRMGADITGGLRVFGAPSAVWPEDRTVKIKRPRRKMTDDYVLRSIKPKAPAAATSAEPKPVQVAEANRLKAKLDDLNPDLADRLWSEHAYPYTETQYQTLITALAAEVQSAEGGPA